MAQSKFMDVLKKAGLVEVDEPQQPEPSTKQSSADIGDLARYADIETATQNNAAPAAEEASLGFEEGLDPQLIFAKQAVPKASFSAERLQKLLDGLGALDADTRKIAIQAMDASDDSWAMGDTMDDAVNKVQALADYEQTLAELVRKHVAKNTAQAADIEKKSNAEVAELHQQIEALQKQIETISQNSAAELAKLNAESEAAKSSYTRECARLDAVSANYQQLIDLFGGPKHSKPEKTS